VPGSPLGWRVTSPQHRQAPRQVDVTDSVENAPSASGFRTLLLHRPVRHPVFGDIPANGHSQPFASFHSAEAAAPALRLSLTVQYR